MTMNSEYYEQLCLTAINASVEAGRAILKHYYSNYSIEYKTDNSPLTIADNDSHAIISKSLTKTTLPILSEEGRSIPYDERKDWVKFWMVDPLDGTKEFINRNGEFTVNIALIENSVPVIGVIYVPVNELLYFAVEKLGSFRLDISKNNFDFSTTTQLSDYLKAAEKLPIQMTRPVTIVGSRSHQNPDNTVLINRISELYEKVQVTNAGSSLKFCKIAEGSADYYPRLGPTMEWDTAAGDAIARYSGAKVIHYKSYNNLIYNKENLLNPHFIVIAEKHSLHLDKL